MTRRALFFVLFGTTLILSGVGLVVKAFFFSGDSGPAALQINSFPKAEVYINDAKTGETPYSSDKLTAGEYTLRLSADNKGQTLTWAGRIKLTADTLTYINRELGPDSDSSAGEVLSLEKSGSDDKAEIAVISDPTGASVRFDGKDNGVTPVTIKDISAADHEIVISAPGFRDRFIRGRTIAGFRLDISVQLAKATPQSAASPSAAPAASPSAQPAKTETTAPIIAKPYVIIKDTGLGWLRVRAAPSISASESARVNTGDKFPLVTEQTGWVKIRYQGTNEGWVNAAYVEKVK